MAVDPNSLVVAPRPMSRPPNIIRAACIITRAANVVRPVANLDRDGARIASIIRCTISTIVGPVIARVSSVIPFTAYCAEHCET